MRSVRLLVLVLLSAALGAVGVLPASAAKPPPAELRITSVVAVDTPNPDAGATVEHVLRRHQLSLVNTFQI